MKIATRASRFEPPPLRCRLHVAPHAMDVTSQPLSLCEKCQKCLDDGLVRAPVKVRT